MARAVNFKSFSLFLLALVLLCLPMSAFAQDSATLHVEVIVANTDYQPIEGKLKRSENELRAQFSNFGSFVLASSERLLIALQQTQSVELPGGQRASFTLKNVHDNRYEIEIQVPGGKTTIDAVAGAKLFVGGPRVPNGVLILRIWIHR